MDIIPLPARVDRIEALVVMVVTVELDVYPGVVGSLVQWRQSRGIPMRRTGRVGRNVPVDDLALAPAMRCQVGSQKVERGRIDRPIQLVQSDDMPAPQVIAVIGQLLSTDIGRMCICSKVIPVGCPRTVAGPIVVGVRTRRLDVMVAAHLHEDPLIHERPVGGAKIVLIVRHASGYFPARCPRSRLPASASQGVAPSSC